MGPLRGLAWRCGIDKSFSLQANMFDDVFEMVEPMKSFFNVNDFDVRWHYSPLPLPALRVTLVKLAH